MNLQFRITFKSGIKTVAVVDGLERNSEHFKVEDVGEKVIDAEQYLERLTGLRVHIEQVL